MTEKKNGSHPQSSDNLESSRNPLMPPPLFDRMTGEQQEELLSSLDHILRLSSAEDYSGPLAPTSEIARLEGLAPGSGERILDAYEARERHRTAIADRLLDILEARATGELEAIQREHIDAHAMARVMISASIKYERRGQWFALILTVAVAFAATNLITAGNVAIGLALIGLHALAMSAVFVYGWRESRERLAKLKAITQPDETAKDSGDAYSDSTA